MVLQNFAKALKIIGFFPANVHICADSRFLPKKLAPAGVDFDEAKKLQKRNNYLKS